MDYIIDRFPEISFNQIKCLVEYQRLITDWNQKINLISRKDIGNFVHRHIVPCLCINRVVRFCNSDSIIDVGTGGGLPGIPLAITNTSANFCLVDSVKKKICAVQDMVASLVLNNVHTKCIRVEEIEQKYKYIVARAVTNFPNFLTYIRNIKKNTTKIFYIKGGNFLEELKNIENYRIHNIGEMLDDEALKDKVIIEIF